MLKTCIDGAIQSQNFPVEQIILSLEFLMGCNQQFLLIELALAFLVGNYVASILILCNEVDDETLSRRLYT